METRWYAIYEDDTYNEFTEPSTSIRCSFWVCEIPTGKEYKTSNGNVWDNNYYKFFDKELNEIQLNFSGWKILKICDEEHKTIYSKFIIRISDPKNQVKSNFDTSTTIYGVMQVIKLLREMSKFESWENYELHKQNVAIQKQFLNKENELTSLIQHVKQLVNLPQLTEIITEIDNLKKIDFHSRTKQFEVLGRKYSIDKSIIRYWYNNLND